MWGVGVFLPVSVVSYLFIYLEWWGGGNVLLSLIFFWFYLILFTRFLFRNRGVRGYFHRHLAVMLSSFWLLVGGIFLLFPLHSFHFNLSSPDLFSTWSTFLILFSFIPPPFSFSMYIRLGLVWSGPVRSGLGDGGWHIVHRALPRRKTVYHCGNITQCRGYLLAVVDWLV